MHELANMLHDLRWSEVPRAFSVALFKAASKGPLRSGLELEFKQLVAYVTFLAFGATWCSRGLVGIKVFAFYVVATSHIFTFPVTFPPSLHAA